MCKYKTKKILIAYNTNEKKLAYTFSYKCF